MHVAPGLRSPHPPGRLGIPKKYMPEHGAEKSSGGRDNVMEMRDDIIGVVEMQVGEIEPERQSRKTADTEHGKERQNKQHRNIKSNRATPQGNEENGQYDDRWNRNNHRGGLEESRDSGSHPGEIHVMGPNNERNEPDTERLE